MKKFLFLYCSLFVIHFSLSAQSTYRLLGDTIKMYSFGANGSTMLLENSTRYRTGAFLRNVANGRTDFAYAIDSSRISNDTMFFHRGDGWYALKLPASGGGGGGSTDTSHLSNRIDLKLNIADTGSMLSQYLVKANAAVIYKTITAFNTDTANIRFRPHAGSNVTLTGTYPDITISASGSAAADTSYATGLKTNLRASNDSAKIVAQIPTNNNALTNGAGYITSSSLTPYLTSSTAASTYLPVIGGTITGTGGNGYINFIPQASAPSAPATGFKLYATSAGAFAWMTNLGYSREFRVRAQTQSNIYHLYDKSYTVADSADVAAEAAARIAAIALKQNLITLSTTGSSGAATFNQSTGALNIPSYSGGSSGLSAVTAIDSTTPNQITLPKQKFTIAGYLGGAADSIILLGNSIMFGYTPGGTIPSYGIRLATSWSLPYLNLALSSTGSFYAAKMAYAHTQPYHNNIEIYETPYNDARKGGIGRTTQNKVINAHNAIIANHFMKAYVAGGSSSATRYGTWTTGFNVATGGGKTSNGAYTSTLNDSITYSFIDSTVIIGLQAADGVNFSYADFTIYIDGVSYATATENFQTDGLSDVSDSNRLSAMAYIVRGLTNTSHKIKLINNSTSKTLVVDYFGHLIGAQYAKPILVFDAPYMTTTGYTLGSPNYNNATSAKMDTMNLKADSLIAAKFYGYPVIKVRTNNYYVPTIASGDVDADNVHPTVQGHIHIRDAALAAYTYPYSTPAEGTVRYDFANHKISWYDGTAWQTSGSSSTTDTSLLLHKAGVENITGTKTITTALSTVASTPAFIAPLVITSTLTTANAADSSAGLRINITSTGSALLKPSIYANSDFMVNGIRIGGGRSTDQTNVAFGKQALDAVTTGTNNGHVAIGNQSFKAVTNASFNNTGVGFNTGLLVTTGTSNTAIGTNAMNGSATGASNNTAVGLNSLGSTTGSNNVAIGSSAGRNFAGFGVAIGNAAGQNETGSNKLYIANDALAPTIGGDLSTHQAGVYRSGYSARWHLPPGTPTAGTGPLKFSFDSLVTTATSGTGTAVTITFAAQPVIPFAIGSTVYVSGITPSGYNAPNGVVVSACTTTSVTYANTTTGTQTVAGRVTAGRLLTTPEPGAFEYVGTRPYFTGSDGVRGYIALTFTGTAAPTTTPSVVGDRFVDTTNKKDYVATGTSSSADWTITN